MISRARIASIVCVVLFSGCASYEAQAFRVRAASSVINRFEKDGFVLAATLPDDAEYVERHLGRDLRAWNVLPVEIFLENRSENANFELMVRNATFKLADGTEFDRLTTKDVLEEVSYSGARSIPLWFLLIFPGAISLSNISAANESMANDFDRKALEDLNVAPRSVATQGVLFFRPRDKELEDCRLSEGILSLQVTKRSASAGGENFLAQISF